MTVKEKARNYLWSRIQSTEIEYKWVHDEMREPGDRRISMDKLELMLDATDRKLDMYNYLFKLVELDEE
jgi:hypothetical protein